MPTVIRYMDWTGMSECVKMVYTYTRPVHRKNWILSLCLEGGKGSLSNLPFSAANGSRLLAAALPSCSKSETTDRDGERGAAPGVVRPRRRRPHRQHHRSSASGLLPSPPLPFPVSLATGAHR
jgi:hypothetical protein